MKKVAILTINDDNNYGNRLQNYATQEFLKKENLEVETVENYGKETEINYLKRKIKNIIKKFLFFVPKFKRYNKFKKFNKNIKYSRIHIKNAESEKKINSIYDSFFTGSDQVWNPTFGRMSDIDFLTFADKKKRNSFSASFGISEIPQDLKEYYREKLNELNHISVRENRAKEIIDEITNRKDTEVLIDPTMLLDSYEWDKIAKKPSQKKNSKKYILNYFLGEISDERKKEINRIAQENDCEIINLLDKKDKYYKTGPSEFLWLEKNAFLICTDSFHSSVFAIIYNKPFIVFNREDDLKNMNSRLETLLSKFELQNRYYNGKITDNLLKIDYQNTYKKLEKEKEKADKFIKYV